MTADCYFLQQDGYASVLNHNHCDASNFQKYLSHHRRSKCNTFNFLLWPSWDLSLWMLTGFTDPNRIQYLEYRIYLYLVAKCNLLTSQSCYVIVIHFKLQVKLIWWVRFAYWLQWFLILQLSSFVDAIEIGKRHNEFINIPKGTNFYYLQMNF